MNEDFLKEGNQTKITAKIKEISDSIGGNDINFIKVSHELI